MNASLIHKLIRYLIVILVFTLFGFMFWPFITAILVASLFAFALNNQVKKLTVRGFSLSNASLIVIVLLLTFIAIPLTFVSLKAFWTVKYYAGVGIQNTPLYAATEQLLHQVTDWGIALATDLNMDISKIPKPTELLGEYSSVIGSYVTSALTKLPRIGLGILVFFLSLYFFLNESKRVKNFILQFDLLAEDELDKVSQVIQKSSFLTLIASLIIGVIQALVVTVFAFFCGFHDVFIVFVVSFVFSLIPVVGSAPVSLFLAAICVIQGNTWGGVAMVVALVIASLADSAIKPFILNVDSKDLHPIVSLLALIGALMVYGPAGILLGPVLTQLAFNILSIFPVAKKSPAFTNESPDF